MSNFGWLAVYPALIPNEQSGSELLLPARADTEMSAAQARVKSFFMRFLCLLIVSANKYSLFIPNFARPTEKWRIRRAASGLRPAENGAFGGGRGQEKREVGDFSLSLHFIKYAMIWA